MPAPKELHPTSSLPELYGAKLRKLRLRAGWTQRELGDRVPIAHSRIAQFELGKEIPPKDVSDALDRLLGADGDLCDLWAHIQTTPIPNWARRYVELEPQACKIRKYMAHTVPGLLQTRAYARALLSIARPSVGGGWRRCWRRGSRARRYWPGRSARCSGPSWTRPYCGAGSAERPRCTSNWANSCA